MGQMWINRVHINGVLKDQHRLVHSGLNTHKKITYHIL